MAKRNSVKLDRKANLYLKDVGAKGRGLFCEDDIEQGEELETTPALVFDQEQDEKLDETLLGTYVFTTGDITKKMQKKLRMKTLEGSSCVVMGIASFCNHDEAPNAEVVWEERNNTLYYTLRATADIPKNTEICTSYGDEWFEEREFEKIAPSVTAEEPVSIEPEVVAEEQPVEEPVKLLAPELAEASA